jgi:multiple antibiotic resistance protein
MEHLLNSFVVLFIVIDPIGVSWLFAAMTHYTDRRTRRAMALRGVALAAVILLLFYFIGDALLDWMGITIPAFRIAGGVLLFLLAIDMVFARQSGLRSTTTAEQHEAEQRTDLSVFPLAFPLLAGPGALTTVLLMTANNQQAPMFWGSLLVLVAVLMVTLVALLTAGYISRLLGETGANVVSRLLGLILAALAVQFVIDGIKNSFY